MEIIIPAKRININSILMDSDNEYVSAEEIQENNENTEETEQQNNK